jgi:hypothetical protein
MTNELLITGALMTAGIGVLYQLKAIPEMLFKKLKQSIVYSVIIYDGDDLFHVLEKWLFKNYNKKYKEVEAGYSILRNVYPGIPTIDKSRYYVSYRQGNNVFTVKYKGKRLLFKKTKTKIEHATQIRDLFSHKFEITGWKAKKEINQLLEEITEEYNKSLEDNRIAFYGWMHGRWESISRRLVKPISDIVLNSSTKAFLINDLNRFLTRKQWYIDTNIAYKRTYMFYGEPGTGKSTLTFAIAAETKRNIYILNLASVYSDDALVTAFQGISDGSILLLEDVDAAFIERQNNKDSKITFSCLLNCLDGAMSKENIITILTTNHIEKIDPALIRAGRTDVKLEIGPATDVEISEYLTLFYGEKSEIIGNFKVPMSLVQEICMRNNDVKECKKELYALALKTNGVHKALEQYEEA